MKNILILFGLLVLTGPKSIAQFGKEPILNLQNEDKRLLNWGYYLGFNQYDFQFEYKNDIGRDVLVDKSIGFNVGLIGELNINEFLDTRFEPGLLYTARTLGFPGFSTEAD
ncbi:MAG: outer membrane beta-barrel protein, partial [Bacteroidota bacterium]|nr:outer membrane beta-barrel protein [Bacteroidota bacterium]